MALIPKRLYLTRHAIERYCQRSTLPPEEAEAELRRLLPQAQLKGPGTVDDDSLFYSLPNGCELVVRKGGRVTTVVWFGRTGAKESGRRWRDQRPRHRGRIKQ